MTRRAASVALLAALALAAWQLPGELRRWDNRAAAARSWSRELPAASQLGIDPRVFDRLARRLPRDAVFYVAIPRSPDLQALAFRSLAADALLPRRHVEAPRGADYVVAFRVAARSAGLPLRRVERLAPQLELAEVR